MNKIFSLILNILVMVPLNLVGEIRTPHMPRELEHVEQPSFRRIQKVEEKSRPKPEKVRRKGLQGIEYHKTFSEMNYEELKKKKIQLASKENWTIVPKYLERMITLCDDINEKADLILELADAQLVQGFYDDAAKQYKEFMHLYPGNERIEYASYKAITCTSQRMLSFDRDQTSTEETLELTKTFLDRADLFTTYSDAVRAIQKQCYELLAESEMNISEFYIKQGDYLSAQNRLTHLRSDWLEKAPNIGFRLALLEENLSIQYSDFKMPESSLKIVSDFKEHTPKKKMAQRF